MGIVHAQFSGYAVIMTNALDRFDRAILTTMQRDSARTVADIASEVGLSQSPCWRRIDRLQREGFIERQVAIVDPQKVGLDAHLFVQIKLDAHGRAHLDDFAARVRSFDEVLECWVLIGPVDFMLRVVAADLKAYERFFFDKLSRLPGVREITAMAALSKIKSTTALPIPAQE
ncbi:MAG: hypothetical protein RLZZ58_1021 [Pseudomonadota bacterium]|jgi:Lrp/AsnC family transcriptional regulator